MYGQNKAARTYCEEWEGGSGLVEDGECAVDYVGSKLLLGVVREGADLMGEAEVGLLGIPGPLRPLSLCPIWAERKICRNLLALEKTRFRACMVELGSGSRGGQPGPSTNFTSVRPRTKAPFHSGALGVLPIAKPRRCRASA